MVENIVDPDDISAALSSVSPLLAEVLFKGR